MIPGHAAGSGNTSRNRVLPAVTPINNCGYWKVVNTTNVPSVNNYLNASAVLTIPGKDIVQVVWAVGYYTDSNGHAQTLIEKRKGTTWTVIPSPSPGFNNVLTGVIVNSLTSALAVGYSYTTDPSVDGQTLVEQWDGTSWTIVSSPNPGTANVLNAVTQIPGSSLVLSVGSVDGQPLIEQFDGTNWVNVPAPSPAGTAATLNGILITTNGGWAVGSYVNGSGNTQTLVERLKSSIWKLVSSPNAPGTDGSILTGVAKISSSNTFLAVGYSTTISSNTTATLIEQWDGSSWSVVSSPNVGNSALFAIDSGTISDLWTVGYGTNGSGVTQTLVLHYDTLSASWIVFSSPNIGTGNNALHGMGKVGGNDAYFVVGSYLNIKSKLNQSLIETYCR